MAEQRNYTQLVQQIIEAVGGKENIISIAHCMTRLRFVLKDDTLPDAEKLTSLQGVQGVMNQGGQYQIVIGTNVSEVYPFAERELNLQDQTIQETEVKKENIFNRLMKTISSCVIPMLGILVASGIIKGILSICTTCGVLSAESGTYLILYAAADSVLYFMPIIVGFTCGKVFKCNPYITAVIGAALLYPNLITALSTAAEEGKSLTFLGVNIMNTTYSSTLLPIIAASYAASHVERLCKKYIPQMLQLMFVPAITLAIIVPLVWLVIGPLMNMVSNGLSGIIMSIYGFFPILGGILFGAFWQLVVLLGLHTALATVLYVDFFAVGQSQVLAILGVTVWALAGVSLGYALKKKDSEKKSLGFGNLASCLCGITEPTIYSICINDWKCFIACFIGGGIGGGILSFFGGTMYALAGDGLFRIPGMINPAGIDISFYGFLGAALIAMAISAIISFILIDSGKSKEDKSFCKSDAENITSPVTGKIIALENVPDPTFSEKMMGEGVAFDFHEETVFSPVDGEIMLIPDTCHAIGIKTKDGAEILIHIGLETVGLHGKGFTALIKTGDTVTAGQPLIHVDQNVMKQHELNMITMMVVTNSDLFNVSVEHKTDVCHGDLILRAVKK